MPGGLWQQAQSVESSKSRNLHADFSGLGDVVEPAASACGFFVVESLEFLTSQGCSKETVGTSVSTYRIFFILRVLLQANQTDLGQKPPPCI